MIVIISSFPPFGTESHNQRRANDNIEKVGKNSQRKTNKSWEKARHQSMCPSCNPTKITNTKMQLITKT